MKEQIGLRSHTGIYMQKCWLRVDSHTDTKAGVYGVCTGTPVRQTPGGLPAHDPEDSRGGEASHRFLKHSALSPSDQSTIRVLRASLSASVSSPLSLSMWMARCLSETLGTAQHQTRALWWHASCPKESIIVSANVFRHPGVWRRVCVCVRRVRRALGAADFVWGGNFKVQI